MGAAFGATPGSGFANWTPPSLPQGVVDAAAGFGDTLSFGITRGARSLFDFGTVDASSSAYGYGEAGGVALSVSFGGAHLGRAAWNQMGRAGDMVLGLRRVLSDPRGWGAVQRTWSRSVGGYKGLYELHHWFTPRVAGGSNAGWNYMAVSPRLNSLMGSGGWAYNSFKGLVIGIYGAIPTAAINETMYE
jgi:hypothetical protein